MRVGVSLALVSENFVIIIIYLINCQESELETSVNRVCVVKDVLERLPMRPFGRLDEFLPH